MNRDDITRMAREAHRQLVTLDYPGHLGQLDPWTMQLLERFFHLAAVAEREACAKVCDDKAKETFSGQCQVWGDYFARAIRARGQQ